MRLKPAALAFALLCTAAPQAYAQSVPAPAEAPAQSFVTRHVGTFNGQKVKYVASVAETVLRNADGEPTIRFVTTSYVREGLKDKASRPVIFLFNGGPSSASTWLHMGAFGPKKRTEDGPNQRMVDNPDSILDAVDLVFIDPIGTGYSRPFPGVDGKTFWSRDGDAASVKSVMAQWLKANGREASPRYMLGQSYGTTRAALVADIGADLKLDGVLLFALVGYPPGREMPFVTTLPTFATTAWYHRKVAGRSVQQVHDEAVEFARTQYVTALIKGASLPEAEKRAVAEKMSAMIGLPTEFILAKDLRLSREDFMFNLLKDQGLRTGQLDGRATARLDAPAKRPPYDDPGMGFAEPRPAGPAQSGVLPVAKGMNALESYFKDTLKFRTSETYNSLNLDVNAAWDHQGMADVNGLLGKAMQASPKMRLFWAAGYYDVTTPPYGARYALDQAGVPGERLTAAYFDGGHSVFTDPGNHAALSAAVRRFVRP